MKEGWVIASLDDACNVDYGTRIVQSKSGGTIYPVYGGGGETFRTDTFNRKDCIVIARFAMSKTCVRFVPGEFFLNDSGLSVSAKEGISQGYLEKYMFYLNDDIYNLGKGAAQRNLDVKQFRKLPVKYPVSLELQQSIVSELDLINELISKKKAQLKDLDSLAQSLFYEMFGDPVENERGWEVKKLREVVKFSQGMQVPIENQKHDKEDGDARFLRIIDFTQGTDEPRYISDYDEKCYITKNDIAIVRYGTPGFVCTNKEGVIANNLFRIIPIEPVFNGKIFLQYWLNSNAFQATVKGNRYGAALQAIRFSTINNLPIILPPLSLQQTFASRIEAIEEEKQKIESSLQDLETLLASRMQYWFD